MNHILYKHLVCFVLLFILTFLFNQIPTEASAEGYDHSHRTRDCEVILLSNSGEPLAGYLIGISQISNDFAFGGTIHGEAFDTLGDGYGDNFLNFFDIGTPEIEMNWEYVMKCSQKCDSDFSKADFLVNWMIEKRIPVRGHNLFCNEKEDRVPQWTRNLGTAEFKQAMKERIDAAMGHFKGNVVQWDLINEICKGEMLQTKSGDPDIFNWIMDEARKKDSVADFVISDYNIITTSDQSAADQFINKVKPLSDKFEIVGAEGHFGVNMNKNSYEPNINYLAEQLGKPVWLTDVDFSSDINQAPDKIEELMRTCFANPNVGGLIMGSWCARYMSGSDITSYLVDSLNNETPTGQRWREVRDEWKTEVIGSTDDSGKFSFNGFQGKYQVIISCYSDTFYLEPGEGTKKVEVTYLAEAAVNNSAGQKKTKFFINGIPASIKLPASYNKQLLLITYSLSGKQLSRYPVSLSGERHQIIPASPSCRIFRIETFDRQPLYTGKIMAVR